MASQAQQTPATSPAHIDFNAIKRLVLAEAGQVDQLIVNELRSDVALINQMGQYIVGNGGKRLRPMLVLLVGKALAAVGGQHLILAAVIEFIHTATLLHDDVVDESELRRGRQSANAVWGNAASVLVGDYLYSKAFEMMVRTGNLQVMDILSKTTTAIAEGEVLQLLNCNNPDTTEAAYLEVISRKTAILFSAAARLGAVAAGAGPEVQDSLGGYGQHLGVAFQLIDDALDYKASEDDLGKKLGDDLAEGKPTLPLIHAMRHASPPEAALIVAAIKAGDRDAFDEVYHIVRNTQAIAYTEQRAREEAARAVAALAPLPPSAYKDALAELARFSVQRSH